MDKGLIGFPTGITQLNAYLLLTPNSTYHPTYQGWRPCWAQRSAYHEGSKSPTHLCIYIYIYIYKHEAIQNLNLKTIYGLPQVILVMML